MKKLPIYPTEQNSTVKEPFQMTNTKHLIIAFIQNNYARNVEKPYEKTCWGVPH